MSSPDQTDAPDTATHSVIASEPDMNVFRPPGDTREPDRVPPIYLFNWGERQGLPEPADVRIILLNTEPFGGDYDAALDYIRTNPDAPEWQDWVDFDSFDGDLWTSPELPAGSFVFAVQSRDDAGVVNPNFDFEWNARKLIIDPAAGGPRMIVTNEYLDPVISNSTFMRTTLMNIPYGIPLEFCFKADANYYGGTVTEYRYGWDILDLNDPDQWEIDFTPYDDTEICLPTRAFNFGTHTLHIETKDHRGVSSRVGIRINTLTPDQLAIDFKPQWCRNSIKDGEILSVWVAITPHAGVDVNDIDFSSVRLWAGGDELEPQRVFVEDVTSPVINGDYCECPSGTDGIDDLVMTFRPDDVLKLLNAGQPNERDWIVARGMMKDSIFFSGQDCVNIVVDGPIVQWPDEDAVGAPGRSVDTHPTSE